MKRFDQNSVLNSQWQALTPSPVLIDGRTEQDWLSFLTEFASVINFYDSDNTINGNWSPFLLKDPVFLLAYISTTRFNKYHSLYNTTCASLTGLLRVDDGHKAGTDLGGYFNQLFDQLFTVFMKIKRWVYFMHRSPEEYDLERYVKHQVHITFSKYFWALIALRQNLYITSKIEGIKPVDPTRFYFFDAYDENIWKKNKDNNPYWDVLGLKHPVKNNLNIDYFTALTHAGDELFNFFHIIISKAKTSYETLKTQKSVYPDTMLLRAFVNLLQVHQQQLNGIAQKHLDFYYKDILLQTERFAQPDSTYLFAELARTDATFSLAANTLFYAGIDAQKNPVLFANSHAENLNPAVINTAYTLARLQGTDSSYSFSLQNIPSPGVLQKDTNGNVQQWDTFGGSSPGPVNTGMAFASPMLLLREGQRNIRLHFGCAETDVLLKLLQNATFYLSTQKTWLPLKTDWVVVSETTAGSAGSTTIVVLVTINLAPWQPPIEAFAKNPDGLDSAWPMLKIELSSLYDIETPPVLTSLSIDVTVSQLKTFQLYNDSGALSTKKPYPLFGPMPLMNSSFIIGNNEIFSKPLTALYIELHWDVLPNDFATYYQQYNNYINPPPKSTKTVPAPEPKKDDTDSDNGFVKFLKFVWKIITWPLNLIAKLAVLLATGIVKLFKPGANTDDGSIPFNNVCFTVDFQMLQASAWRMLDMTKDADIKFPHPNEIKADPYHIDKKCAPNAEAGTLQLFSTAKVVTDAGQELDCQITRSSFFSYTTATPLAFTDPIIQNLPAKFEDGSTSGYMRMMLTGPVYGFGSQVYADVVNNIAFQNALQIKIDDGKFIKPANLPFVPKLVGFAGHYTASQTYVFTETADLGYPVQCFMYSPFDRHKVYDSTQPVGNYQYTIDPSVNKAVNTTRGIPLFSAYKYSGYLFIGLNNLIPSASLSIYFELSRKSVTSDPQKQIDYYYLSTIGWKRLQVIADGTNNLSCPGIIKVNVPDDAAMGGAAMPGDKKFWVSAAIKGDAGSVAQTSFLKTNAFEVTRTGNSFLNDNIAPQLPGNTITRPQIAVPQIAKITQPFPSGGGTVAENQAAMNQRISSRLKTKDRAVSVEDHFRLIKHEFPDVYFSKIILNKPKAGNTGVYVVKVVANNSDAGAFLPLVSECTESKIQSFLDSRTSAFSNIVVSNFNPQYVMVKATITLKSGFETYAMQVNISNAVNTFLSPWITSDSAQIIIDQGITSLQVIKLIKGVDGVLQVSDVAFKTWMMSDNYTAGQIMKLAFKQDIGVLLPTTLLVPYTVHDIICKPAA